MPVALLLGLGEIEYSKVLQNPKLMPKELSSFEQILSAAPEALNLDYAIDEPLENSLERSYESGSNRIGWGFKPGVLKHLHIDTSPEFIRAMVETDRSERASIGGDYPEIWKKYITQLKKIISVHQGVKF